MKCRLDYLLPVMAVAETLAEMYFLGSSGDLNYSCSALFLCSQSQERVDEGGQREILVCGLWDLCSIHQNCSKRIRGEIS